MPILDAEPDAFPIGLFGPGDCGVDAGSWMVLHTLPRQEKCVARELHHLQIPFYLPLVEHRRIQRGRMYVSSMPLFPSYVFLAGARDQRLAALRTNRILHTLTPPDPLRLWRELRQIQRMISSGAPVTLEQRLAPGDLVVVTSGPLAGLEGVINRTASGRRLVVYVNFIRQGASVLLDDCSVRAI